MIVQERPRAVSLSYRDYISSVAWQLRRISPGSALGDWCDERAWRLERCGQTATVETCADCGAPIPGTVQTERSLVAPACECRSCPWCARRRAAQAGDYARRVAAYLDDVEGSAGWKWHLITMTTERDKDDPASAEWPALQQRARAIRAAVTAMMRTWRRKRHPLGGVEVYAGWCGVECGPTGHVHVHILVALDTPLYDWTAGSGAARHRRCMCARGASYWDDLTRHIGVGRIADARPVTEPASAIAEVVKYSIKLPGSGGDNADAWIAGDVARCADPRVAAHWEVATRGLRLRERYGLARHVRFDEGRDKEAEEEPAAEPAEPAAPVEPCAYCGGVERELRIGCTWQIVADLVLHWGVRALATSREPRTISYAAPWTRPRPGARAPPDPAPAENVDTNGGDRVEY